MREETDKAIETFETANRLNPARLEILANLCMLYVKESLNKALKLCEIAYQRAVELQHGVYAEALFKLIADALGKDLARPDL